MRQSASPAGKDNEETECVLVSFDKSGLPVGRSRVMVLASESLSPPNLPQVGSQSVLPVKLVNQHTDKV